MHVLEGKNFGGIPHLSMPGLATHAQTEGKVSPEASYERDKSLHEKQGA